MINFAAALIILILSGYLASKRLAKLESPIIKEPSEAQEAEKSNEIKKEPSKKRAPKKVKVKVKKKKKKK
jgi:hypothetical protein